MSDANTWLDANASTGAASVKWNTPGTQAAGEIISIGQPVTKDLNSGEPKTNLVITVRDDSGEELAIWVKSGNMANGVREALAKAGATKMAVGDRLGDRFDGEGERSQPGYNPPKLFTVSYAVKSAADVSDLV